MQKTKQFTDWNHLFKISTVAAFATGILIPISIIAYFIWPVFPGSAEVIFRLIQEDRLAGLMSLDFLYLLGNLLAIPLFLVLYITLKKINQSLSAIALTLGLIALVSLLFARPIFEMISLSDQYASATLELQREQYVAAGEAMLALFHGTAFQVHYLFGSVSLLISSVLMLRSQIFSRATACVGILSNLLVFGLYIPEIGVYLSILSVFPFLLIWYLQIGRRLFQLVKETE